MVQMTGQEVQLMGQDVATGTGWPLPSSAAIAAMVPRHTPIAAIASVSGLALMA
jgi:hypothetical protein